MRRFGTFVRRSIAQGLRWLHGILGWWLVPVGTLGLVGVVIVFEIDNWPTWLWVQVISVAVVALLIVGAYQVWDEADRRTPEIVQTPSSPNPLTVLTWNGSDYAPETAKAWKGPKAFYGPVPPSHVEGVAYGDNDLWFQVGDEVGT